MPLALPALKDTSFIDGRFESPEGTADQIIDPATGEVIASVAPASRAQLDKAIGAARRAFDKGDWPHMPVFERGQVLRRIADRILTRADDLALVEAMNGGKPISSARREVEGAARVFAYYAGAMDKFFGDTIPVSDQVLTFTLREPLGVVAQITPWNFPLLAAAWKLAPALAAGCVSLLKPSPLTPLSALLLAEIAGECGVPAGVVNVLPGGGETGRVLAGHPAIDGISFTGSTVTGAEVMRTASATIKSVALELGGKNANIIFADADLERAAKSAVGSAFGNAGQSCSARSRILVERPALQAFTELLRLKLGSPLDPSTTLGPLISASHWSRVDREVRAAKSSEAKLLLGGGRPDNLPAGNFYLPTVFGNVSSNMTINREEIFGPVCSIGVFDSEAEAVSTVNESIYGLNGSVWSRDIGQALRVARAVRTGMIAVNGLPSASSQSLFSPFGGYKRSGLGRELGVQGLAFYTETKSVTVDLSGGQVDAVAGSLDP
jgi:acyl-CoA reductase-like NAD-dependent aldehyde dehydrogenase